MKIQIYGDWYVHTDSRNFIVRKRKMVADPETFELKETWQSEHFLSTFESALQRVITEVIRDSKADNIGDLLAEIQHMRETIDKLFHVDNIMPSKVAAPIPPSKPKTKPAQEDDSHGSYDFG